MNQDGAAVEFGERTRYWVLLPMLAVAGTVLIMAANPGRSWPQTISAIAMVLLTQAIYVSLARPGRTGIRTNGWRAWTFAAVAVALIGPAVYLNPWSAMSLFALTPQVFLLLTFGWATTVIVFLNLFSAVAALVSGPHEMHDVIQQFGVALFIVTFSLFLGSRLVSVNERSAERLRLIGQLREREAEVAALSAARGAEQERSRFAREMHDTLAQGFTSIVTLGHAVLNELDTDPATARRHVQLITATAGENLTESRRIIKALSPARLDGASLAEAVKRIVTAFAEETGTPARTVLSGDPVAAAPGVDVVILRVVQESLANARKHARARSVEVRLAYSPDSVEVEICDNGIGFATDVAATGFGLAGMRARVDDAGGELRLQSAPGEGARVRAHVPLEVPR